MTDTIKRMTDVWGVIRSTLAEKFSFSEIKLIVGYAGFDMQTICHLEQKQQNGATKSILLSEIDKQLNYMDSLKFNSFVNICCEKAIEKKIELLEPLMSNLKKLGWNYINGNIIPISILSFDEFNCFPQDSLADINNAITRFRENDLSGVMTSICGTLESVTSNIYKKYGLRDHSKASFQEKITVSLKALKVFENLEKELADIQWDNEKIKIFVKNLEGSLNQAAFVMQILRSKIGDVHGTKNVIDSLVYDSIKWSALLLRMLS